MDEELDETCLMGGRNELIDGDWLYPLLLLLEFRAWPEKRVSGEAVRRGVEDWEESGENNDLAGKFVGDGCGSFKTSFRDVFGPILGTCHGDVFSSPLSREIVGRFIACCNACCCCFLRSLWESFGVDGLLPFSSLAI